MTDVGLNDQRLEHTRHDAETIRSAALTLCDRAANVTEALDFLDMLGIHQPIRVVDPCPEDEASVARHSQHRRDREKCATCDQAKRDYLRDWHRQNPGRQAGYKAAHRARMRYPR